MPWLSWFGRACGLSPPTRKVSARVLSAQVATLLAWVIVGVVGFFVLYLMGYSVL